MNFETWQQRCHPDWHYPRRVRRFRGLRRVRLFVCACARRIWHLMPDDRCRTAIEIAERFADDLASEKERREAARGAALVCARLYAAHDLESGNDSLSALDLPDRGACESLYREALGEFRRNPEAARLPRYAICAASAAYISVSIKVQNVAPYVAAWATTHERGMSPSGDPAPDAVLAQQRLGFDIYGWPARLKPEIAGPWLAWDNGTVGKMAQTIYDEKTFDQMPVLADALEDAGCRLAPVLQHCREESVHVRGCWVLDLLLQKS